MHHDVSAAASHSDDVVMAPVAEGAALQCTHDGPVREPGAFMLGDSVSTWLGLR